MSEDVDDEDRLLPSTGLLVAIEGLDGSGKTVQASALVSHLESRGRPAHLTREPSDGPIGRLIREFLAGRHALPDRGSDPGTLALLFAADRADHCRREVQPRISAGQVVVSDRWYLTSLAYQCSSHGSRQAAPVTRDWVLEINRAAIRPDLTIFLRIDPEVAVKRLALRGRAREIFEDLPAQRRFTESYDQAIDLVRSLGERVEIVDGGASAEDVGRRVQALIDGLRRTSTCAHGVAFVASAAVGLDTHEIRRRWPRLVGDCPLGCGFSGVAYASTLHYLAGDW